MAKGEPISDKLVQLGCRFFHAIDLPELETYAEEWALMSRAELEKHPNGIRLPFYTDVTDKQLGIFDRCFGNLKHFWDFYWSGYNPNAFGPITLVFPSSTFDGMADVVVTEVGANAAGYNLQANRITDPSTFNWTVSGGLPTVFYEVSTATNRVAFDLLEKVIVEPITVDGVTLEEVVLHFLTMHAGGRAVPRVEVDGLAHNRAVESARLTELLQWSLARAGSAGDLANTLPAGCAQWLAAGNRRPLVPWCRHIHATLQSMRVFAQARAKPPADPSSYAV